MYVAITSKRAETGFKRRKNVGSMMSSIILDFRQSQVFALSYLPRRLRRSNQDLSFFDLCRAPSIPRSPASSIYVVSLDFPRFSLVFAASLEFSRFLDFPRFLLSYVVSLDSRLSQFPRFLRSARSSLDLLRLRSLSRWSYIII